MTWDNITVQQFQMLSEIWREAEGREHFDVMADVVGVCHNLTPLQVDSLSMDEFKTMCKELAFLNNYPEWKPVKSFTTNGRRYRFVYDVRQIHAARNIEVKHFSGDFVQNLHRLSASMVIPQRRNWVHRWVDETYDAAKHDQYAKDILQCPIGFIYGSALFFCEVFRNSIPLIADYLTSPIQDQTMREAARQLLIDSSQITDGNITPQLLQSLSELPSMQPTSYPTSNS